MAETRNIVMPMEQEGSKSVVRAWLKQVGDAVKRDEPIVELETDKVAVEVPAPADGVLTEIALKEGDEAPPGATLGVLTLGVSASDRRLPAGNAERLQTPLWLQAWRRRRPKAGDPTNASPLS
jgi:2-oxoglutarate dehydrogenase E2 component (dihydrolipoamide succinyltransferase)